MFMNMLVSEASCSL